MDAELEEERREEERTFPLGENIFTSDSQWIRTRDMMGR